METRSLIGLTCAAEKLILKLQADIQSNSSSGERKQTTDDPSYEEIIQEVNERNRRRQDLVIFSNKEPNQNLNSTMVRIECDKMQVANVLNFVSPDIDLSNIKPTRLGQFNISQARLNRITLCDEEEVTQIIWNAKVLKNIEYTHI